MEASQIQHGGPRRLVMSAPTPLRQDFDAPQVRGLARRTNDGPQARRLLAVAAIYDGATRTEAAKIGGIGLQIIRDWVLRFNARGPDALLNGKSPGQPCKLGSSCRLRYPYAGILMRRSCAVWPGEPTTVLRPGGFWRLRRSMTVRRAPRRPRSAASGFRSSGTGCCASTLAGLTLS